ncbi:Beta-hexosaminidase 3 [Linum perenne]
MKMIHLLSLLLLIIIYGRISGSTNTPTTNKTTGNFSMRSEVKVWPMPKWSNNGEDKMYMNPGNFKLIGSPSTNYNDQTGILNQAFSRMIGLLMLSHVFANHSSSSSHIAALPHLTAIRVLISSSNDKLQYGIDESYKLMVPSTDKSHIAHLELLLIEEDIMSILR